MLKAFRNKASSNYLQSKANEQSLKVISPTSFHLGVNLCKIYILDDSNLAHVSTRRGHDPSVEGLPGVALYYGRSCCYQQEGMTGLGQSDDNIPDHV